MQLWLCCLILLTLVIALAVGFALYFLVAVYFRPHLFGIHLRLAWLLIFSWNRIGFLFSHRTFWLKCLLDDVSRLLWFSILFNCPSFFDFTPTLQRVALVDAFNNRWWVFHFSNWFDCIGGIFNCWSGAFTLSLVPLWLLILSKTFLFWNFPIC